MTYYNQNDYAHVKYPAPDYESATVRSGGCGVCCGSTILSFFGVEYPPDKLAPIFISKGARVSGGTDMNKAAKIICELGGLTYTTSSSEAELAAHLKGGGCAIANVGGDRTGYTGVFSNGGHYICPVGIKATGELIIYDVGDYTAKYASMYRAAKVKREGKLLVCSPETLDADTKNRTPNYYLFKKEEEEVDLDKFKELMAEYRAELAKGEGTLAEYKSAKDAKITDGTRPKDFVTREEAAVMAYRAKSK